MFLVLAALLAAAPYRPPAVPTPEAAGAGPSPYESQLQVPAVDVATRVVLQSKIVADVPGLASGAAAHHALERQLAADPRWRVVDWQGGRVAYQRVADGKEWTVPLRGYHASADGVWRTAVVLSPWGPGSVWVTSPLVGRAPASSGSIGISQINYEGNPDWRAVAWEWGDPGATLEVFEAGPRAMIAQFPHTNDALSAVPYLVGRIASGAAEVQKVGFAPSLIPPALVRTGEPSLSVSSPAPGELDLRAWVHTPGPGVTWARALDTDLRVWEEQAFAAGTREILGSGKDPRQLFYLQGRFPVPAGPAFSGTVELWHQPDGGGEVVRLAAVPVTLPAR
jgi:hypothetical protein